jgi:hypothetical protein
MSLSSLLACLDPDVRGELQTIGRAGRIQHHPQGTRQSSQGGGSSSNLWVALTQAVSIFLIWFRLHEVQCRISILKRKDISPVVGLMSSKLWWAKLQLLRY